MIVGQKNKFKLNLEMSKILYKWIGASKFIYNAKIEENDYLLTFGRKFFPKTQYQFDEEFHFFDRTYAQFKNQGGEWLNEVPSPILRDAATVWFRTMKKSFIGECERPRRKNRFSNRYVWLCDKLFEFHLINNRWHLEIGTKKFYVGYLSITFPKNFFKKDPSTEEYLLPKTLWIKPCLENNYFTVSFSYDDSLEIKPIAETRQHFFDYAKTLTETQLRKKIEGLDRGVAIPAHSSSTAYSWSNNGEKSFKVTELKRKIKQKKLSRQKNGSKLNRVVLDRALSQMQIFIEYKIHRSDKAIFYINPKNTSLECSDCGHTHPDNRKSQAQFKCLKCGFEANADENSAKTQINRAVNYFLNSRTELGKDGYLSLPQDGSAVRS